MATPNKYTIEIKGNFIKIFINGVLHLAFNQCKLIGFQSFFMGKGWYCIECYFDGGSVIKLEYDDTGKWQSIINLLNENII